MTEHNGETKQDLAGDQDLKKALDEAIKRGETLIRLEMPNTVSLASLEKVLQETVMSRMNAGALVSMMPRFDWWQVGGLWPLHPEGWTVLLRRAQFQGQVRPDVAAAAQQSKLVKG